ncbi:Glutathione S-transferase F5 [Cardamine amara subsp. amara]|uniref:glutathione transferase n=1 Tax=Cardamine amara subsp. amara TaxID=228776 RepID=A0ABD1B536_CARAN
MGSSRFTASLTLVVIMTFSYKSFSWMGVNASDVPTSCNHYCNQTLESRHQCYKRCEKLAHKNGYKIYGYPYSPNTRRVLAVLHEKGLSYDPITVDLVAGEQKKPQFLSLNPFGLVPVFLDGNLKLTESRAISEYIATVHRSRGSQLLNHNSCKAMGTQTMWRNIESFEFDPPASILTMELSTKPRIGLKTDYKLVNETEPKLEKVLDIYEERLKNSRYLAGDSFTLADLYHLPNIQYLMDTPTKRLFINRPNVHIWVVKITARPAWKKACDVKAWYGKKRN